jgi:fibronectin type 3 domain-containing protein
MDTRVEEGQVYTYMVTAVNRAHIESNPSEVITITRSNGRIKKYKRHKRKKRKRKD